jgi:hypothetical protein
MISLVKTEECLNRLGMLKHFPVKPAVVAEVGRLLTELCVNDDVADRLVAAVLRDHSEWCGPAKIRELCEQFATSRRESEAVACCEVCLGTGGYRRVFEVVDMSTPTEEPLRIRCDEPTWAGVMAEEKRIREQYPVPRFEIYNVVAACACVSGRQRAAEWRARKSARP